MNDTTGSKEQASLKHSMGKKMEHTCHETQLSVVVEHTVMTRQRHAEGYHHERNLRDGREGQYSLDVTLGAGHGSSIEGCEHAHPDHDAHLRLGVLNPQGEHTGNLEHTSHHHRSSVDESRYWRGTLHGIRQPDVQREHSRLTGTTNEHQH